MTTPSIGGLTLQTDCDWATLPDSACLHVQLPTGTPYTVVGPLQFPGLPVLEGMSADMDQDAIAQVVSTLCSTTSCIPVRMHGKLMVVLDTHAVSTLLTVAESDTAEMMSVWQDMTDMGKDLELAVVPVVADEAGLNTFRCLGIRKRFLQELRKAFPTSKIYVTASKTVTAPAVAPGLPPMPAEALMVPPYKPDVLEKLRNGTVQATLSGLPPVHLTPPWPQQLRTLHGQASPLVPALWGQRHLAVLTPHRVGTMLFTSEGHPSFQLELPAGPLNTEQLADAVQQGTGCRVKFEVLGGGLGLQVTAETAGLLVQQPGHPALVLPAQAPVQLPQAHLAMALRSPLFMGSQEHAAALEAAGFTVAALDSTHITAVHGPSIQTMLGPLCSTLDLPWQSVLYVSIISIHAPDAPAQLRLADRAEATGLQVQPPETVRRPETMKVQLKPPTQHHAQLLQKLLPRTEDGNVPCRISELEKLANTVFRLPVEMVQQLLEQE